MIRLGFFMQVLAAVACSSGSTGGAADAGPSAASDAAAEAAPASGTCVGIPASAKKQGSGCIGMSGTFTEATIDSVAGTYSETCGATPYKDQSDFDTNEGTSTAAGTVIKSHEDYVVTSTCASGSIDYTASGTAKTTILFVWTKVP